MLERKAVRLYYYYTELVGVRVHVQTTRILVQQVVSRNTGPGTSTHQVKFLVPLSLLCVLLFCLWVLYPPTLWRQLLD